jgi:hypothetical protein
MECISPQQLEARINQALEACDLTRGLRVSVWKTEVVFEEGNNWMSYIEPRPDCRQTYRPTPEAKKMIQKLLGDMRLKYNLAE